MKLNYNISEIYNSISNELNNKSTESLKEILNNIYELRKSKINLKDNIIETINELLLYLTKEEALELKKYLIESFYNSSDNTINQLKELTTNFIHNLDKLNLSYQNVYYDGGTGVKLYKIGTFSNTIEQLKNLLIENICLKNNQINLEIKNKKNIDKYFYQITKKLTKYLTDANLMTNELKEYFNWFQEETVVKNYIKRPKIKKAKIKEIDYINLYQNLTYKLYKLRMNNNQNIEEISKLEYKLLELTNKYNIGNIEKIEALIYAIEKYHDSKEEEEFFNHSKKRGINIYEDLNYKLCKQKSKYPINLDKIIKLEEKIKDCEKKYNLEEVEKIDAQIRILQKYSEKNSKKAEDKKIGLNTYESLTNDLYNLKKDR